MYQHVNHVKTWGCINLPLYQTKVDAEKAVWTIYLGLPFLN